MYSLSKNVIYKPMLVQQEEFDICARQEQLIKTFDARENLCKKLSSLVSLKSQEVLDGQFTDQMSIQEKQVRITSLIEKVGVHSVFLPKDVKGKLKFDFHRLLDNLNTILIAQYLQKTQNCLSKDDIIELQQSDPILKDIINKVMTEEQVNDKFIVKDRILFKLTLMYGVQIFRLCLPMNLAREVLFILHNHKSAHLGTNNLRLKFRSNFWCWGLENALKSIKNNCLICRLNADRKELVLKGMKRRWQNGVTLGKIWQADILYMPTSNEGHKFILTLTERVTSYVCALPLKTLSVKHVCNALEIFLSICPPMEEVHTDHGRADFGAGFTEMLEGFGIKHEGSLPHRSQAQGSVESSNRLLQNQLNRICAENGSYKYWHKSLPKVVMAINSFHPYRAPFSRKQLLYSVFYYCRGAYKFKKSGALSKIIV